MSNITSLLISQYDNNLRRTDQNIGNLSRSILSQTQTQTTQMETLTLNCLNLLQRNYNDTQITEQQHHNDTEKAIAHIKYNIDTQMEKSNADSNLNTLNTANTVRESLNDSTYITNRDIENAKEELHTNMHHLISQINTSFTESNKTTYKQNAQTRVQTREYFELLKTDIRNRAEAIKLNRNLNFTNTDKLIIANSKSDAIGTRDIQLLSLKNKNEQLLFANENASNVRLHTLENTEKLTHRLQENDLQALKHKELLSQQILQKELDLIRYENSIMSALKKKTCEIKEGIEERSKRTQYKLKNDEISRLKEEMLNTQISGNHY